MWQSAIRDRGSERGVRHCDACRMMPLVADPVVLVHRDHSGIVLTWLACSALMAAPSACGRGVID